MFEGGGDGFQGVVTSELQGTVDGHHDGLYLGPLLGSVSVGVFADDDRGADLAFAVIVVCRDIGLQEGEDVFSMFFQAGDQAFAVRVLVSGSQQVIEPLMEAQQAVRAIRIVQGVVFIQAQGIAQEAGQFFLEGQPLGILVDLGDLFQFAEQVDEADLSGRGLQFVVGAPEVGDEDAGEQFSEQCGQDRGAAAAMDQITGQSVVAKTPEPVGDAVNAPAGFMWGTDGTKIFTLEDGWVWSFVAMEHWNGECVGWHVTKTGDRFAALEPISQGLTEQYGCVAKDVARGLKLRMDHGPQYTSEHFVNQVRYWGITTSFAFVSKPETNGVAERFMRTLKEQAIHGRIFRTVQDVREAVADFIELYNQQWLLEKNRGRSPREMRQDWNAALQMQAAA